MNKSTLAEALAPLRARMPGIVREQEILRTALLIDGNDKVAAAEQARSEVLAWAQRRSGGRLPPEAWDHQGFDFLSGGRTSMAVRIQADKTDIWAIRADDPDKLVPQRIWTTEVTIGHAADEKSRLCLRLLVNSPEEQLQIEPHTPGLLQQIAENCGLLDATYKLRATPWIIASEKDAKILVTLLENPSRRLPVFVATGDERSEYPDSPLIDAELLAKATCGLAHVVVLPARYTYVISERFGNKRSVFFGGVRTYMPGFDANAGLYDHRLLLGDNLKTPNDADRCIRMLRSLAASESLRRARLGSDVLTFASVRSAALKLRQENQKSYGATDTEQLESALFRITALEDELSQTKDSETQFYSLFQEVEDRALAAEEQSKASTYQIQSLLEKLKQQGVSPDTESNLPETWQDFVSWCDENLFGRLALAPTARRNVKKPEFSDIFQAARCLLWLANECRDRRISGGGSLSEETVEEGVRNSSCGGDTFDFDWQGQRLSADWHIKNGGNTRDPSRCLRIYYAWDSASQQIVIADMPSHRRTGAT